MSRFSSPPQRLSIEINIRWEINIILGRIFISANKDAYVKYDQGRKERRGDTWEK